MIEVTTTIDALTVFSFAEEISMYETMHPGFKCTGFTMSKNNDGSYKLSPTYKQTFLGMLEAMADEVIHGINKQKRL